MLATHGQSGSIAAARDRFAVVKVRDGAGPRIVDAISRTSRTVSAGWYLSSCCTRRSLRPCTPPPALASAMQALPPSRLAAPFSASGPLKGPTWATTRSSAAAAGKASSRAIDRTEQDLLDTRFSPCCDARGAA